MKTNMLKFKLFQGDEKPGRHIDPLVYATDAAGDTVRSDAHVAGHEVKISRAMDASRIALYVRYNVDGYGSCFLTADNNGEYYDLSSPGNLNCDLDFEMARTRVFRNRKRLLAFTFNGWIPSRECQAFLDLAGNYMDDAIRKKHNPGQCAALSQKSLCFGLWASDLMEIENSKYVIAKMPPRPFYFGCDSRGYFQMEKELFFNKFKRLFNYATITHYLIGDVVNFEPEEGQKQFSQRRKIVDELKKRDITVEGRPLFWTHKWVTPDWLRRKTFSDVLTYVEKHVREVVGFYGTDIHVWEVVNELHDWANELELNHEQTIEITRLACAVARDVNPEIRLLLNHCCLYAEYVHLGKWGEKKALYPQRTPYQFVRDLVQAGVDFDIIGLQLYFTRHLLADMMQIIERFEEFNKTIHITEIGAPSRGLTREFNDTGSDDDSAKPFEWRRFWDESLQADWLEAVFSFAYSKPYIEATSWYDFVDPYGYLKYGGLLRSPKGEEKAAFTGLEKLAKKWGAR
jgi:endo-1,4-beta-xylanase